MLLENIEIEFIDGTELPPDDKRPNIYYIDARILDRPYICPECGFPLYSKGPAGRPVFHYCTGLTSDKKHIYQINLKGRRYECRNPVKKHSTTSGMLEHKSPYTETLKNHIIWYYLQHQKCSFSAVGRYCSMSPPAVSKIICKFAKEINMRFIPHGDYDYFYLRGFHYQGENRCYLAKVTKDHTPILLAFFGFENAKTELEHYLEFHWRGKSNKELTYVSINKEFKYSDVVKKYIPNAFVWADQSTITEWFDSYKIDQNDELFSILCDKIDNLKNHFGKMNKNSLEDWWNDLGPVLQEQLSDLWEELNRAHPFYQIAYNTFNVSFSKIDDEITFYNRDKQPFDTMTLRVMYQIHGDHLFSEEETGRISYDKETDTLYREPVMSPTEKEKKEWEERLGIDEDEPDWYPGMFI